LVHRPAILKKDAPVPDPAGQRIQDASEEARDIVVGATSKPIVDENDPAVLQDNGGALT
jgi:hypothetical protein